MGSLALDDLASVIESGTSYRPPLLWLCAWVRRAHRRRGGYAGQRAEPERDSVALVALGIDHRARRGGLAGGSDWVHRVHWKFDRRRFVGQPDGPCHGPRSASARQRARCAARNHLCLRTSPHVDSQSHRFTGHRTRASAAHSVRRQLSHSRRSFAREYGTRHPCRT